MAGCFFGIGQCGLLRRVWFDLGIFFARRTVGKISIANEQNLSLIGLNSYKYGLLRKSSEFGAFISELIVKLVKSWRRPGIITFAKRYIGGRTGQEQNTFLLSFFNISHLVHGTVDSRSAYGSGPCSKGIKHLRCDLSLGKRLPNTSTLGWRERR